MQARHIVHSFGAVFAPELLDRRSVFGHACLPLKGVLREFYPQRPLPLPDALFASSHHLPHHRSHHFGGQP
jgi:hypothetical protein